MMNAWYVLYIQNCCAYTVPLGILRSSFAFFFSAHLSATFQVQALELYFDSNTFSLSVVCINALGLNNTCDVKVMDAEIETEICQFKTTTSKAYSCQLPERSETSFLVLAYDEDYHTEPAIQKLFLTPKLNYMYTQTDS